MSKRKLLLADDSITIQKVVNLTFADEGIDVISVGDGNSAMDKLREDSPDLVLADVNMPGLNGYEICEKIKETNRETPVILLVGSFEPFDEDEARRVGADDYLTKPFQSISQLVNKVNELLDPVISPEETEQLISPQPVSFDVNSETENSFESQTDTLETGQSESEDLPDYDDVINDDEMIQTDQIGSVPVDEMAKFEAPITPDFNNNPVFNQEESPDNLVEQSYSYADTSPQNDVYEISEEIAVDEFESSSPDPKSEETGQTTDFNVTQTYTPEEKEEFSFTKSNNGQDLIDTQEMEPEDKNKLEVIPEDSNQIDLNSLGISDLDKKSQTNSEIEEIASGSESVGFATGENKEETNLFEIVSDQNEKIESGIENENGSDAVSESEPDLLNFEEENRADVSTDLPIPEAASVLELDEVNLLELPPLETSSEKKSVEETNETLAGKGSEETREEEADLKPPSNETEENTKFTGFLNDSEKEGLEISSEEENMETRFDKAENYPADNPKTFLEKKQTVPGISNESENIQGTISTEMVEAITQKVIEKLSERAIKEIAWEVVPQMADLIIKRLAEEKMKD